MFFHANADLTRTYVLFICEHTHRGVRTYIVRTGINLLFRRNVRSQNILKTHFIVSKIAIISAMNVWLCILGRERERERERERDVIWIIL